MEAKKRIAIVGPESSGKSALSESLGLEYKEPWVKEMARAYLEERNGSYSEHDLLEIAKLQLKEEEKQFAVAHRFLFCDTNLLVIKIWSEWKYNKLDSELRRLWKPNDYALHLLCMPDLPYEEDPLRENPESEDRMALFEKYKKELEKEGVPFAVISGEGNARLKKARDFLDSHFSL